MIWPSAFWWRPQAPVPKELWALDTVLFEWAKGEPFTLDDACKGVQVWGMTGSGKSSGSGKCLAIQYLRQNFGGLVLCAKPGEAETWHAYARMANRTQDLVVFSPDSPWRFNFLQHELARPGKGAGLTENILQLLMTVAEIANRGSGQQGCGSENDGYWKKTLQQLLRNAIDLTVIATGSVSIPDLYRVIVSAPISYEQLESLTWQKKSLCWQYLQKADAATKRGYQQHDFQIVADFFLLEYPGISEKTRSIIVSTFTSMADVLNRGALRELFCSETNVTPEDCLNGKIVIVDLPVKEFAEVGQLAAIIWKYQYQRAVERRDVSVNPRPCFLFVDESQLFTTSFDALFQTTARSSRCCTVYLTQNLNNYLTAYQGPSGHAEAKSLLGNLTTHIVHALGDSDTAQFVADLIGRSKQWFSNGNVTHSPYHPIEDFFGQEQGQYSGGYSETMEYEVQPAQLSRMRTGGPPNRFVVDALVWRGGQPFRTTGRSYLWTAFNQKEN
jgi:hypothetical protein